MNNMRMLLLLVLMTVIILLSGCEVGTVNVGLIFIDEFSKDGLQVQREVLIILPYEDALSRLIVQAQKEGWHTLGGPGMAKGVADRYSYNERLSLTLSDVVKSGQVMSAVKTFSVNDSVSQEPFSRLFKPYYESTKDGNTRSISGRIYANAIWRGFYQEACLYARSKGLSDANIQVTFGYPVLWEVICPARDARSSRGSVEPLPKSRTLIETRMYGAEFLGEVPMTVKWHERSPIATFISIMIGLLLLCTVVIYSLYHNSRRRGF